MTLFSFSILNMSFYWFLASTIPDEKFAINHVIFIVCNKLLFVFKMFSLFLAYSILTMMCLSVFSLYLFYLQFIEPPGFVYSCFSINLESISLLLKIFFFSFLTSSSGNPITYMLEYVILTNRSLKLLILFNLFLSVFQIQLFLLSYILIHWFCLLSS